MIAGEAIVIPPGAVHAFELPKQLVVINVYFLPECFWGCSVGKGFLGLRVCRATTTDPPGLGRGLLRTVLFYLLLVSWFARVAVLIVLAGIAPVALACYSLPQTQPPCQSAGVKGSPLAESQMHPVLSSLKVTMRWPSGL